MNETQWKKNLPEKIVKQFSLCQFARSENSASCQIATEKVEVDRTLNG